MPPDKCPNILHDESAEIREAVIHFELYRLLMNVISTKGEFSSIKYVWVHPECITPSGSSADLVVDAEVGDEIIHFLVIEVKRKTRLVGCLHNPQSNLFFKPSNQQTTSNSTSPHKET